MKISVRADISGALAKLRMVETEARKGIVRALNKTATSVRADAARAIKERGYGLRVGRIKAGLTVKRANAGRLWAIVKASGHPVPLIEFQARQTRKGVTVNVRDGRKLIRHAFIAPLGRRGDAVVMRKQGFITGKRKRQILARAIERELFGPSVPAMFKDTDVMERLVARVHEVFPQRLREELAYLRRLGKA